MALHNNNGILLHAVFASLQTKGSSSKNLCCPDTDMGGHWGGSERLLSRLCPWRLGVGVGGWTLSMETEGGSGRVDSVHGD